MIRSSHLQKQVAIVCVSISLLLFLYFRVHQDVRARKFEALSNGPTHQMYPGAGQVMEAYEGAAAAVSSLSQDSQIVEDSHIIEDPVIIEGSPIVEDTRIIEDSPVIEDSPIGEDSPIVEASQAVDAAAAASPQATGAPENQAESQAQIQAENQAQIQAENQAQIQAENQTQVQAENQAQIQAENQAQIQAEKPDHTNPADDTRLKGLEPQESKPPSQDPGISPEGDASNKSPATKAPPFAIISELSYDQPVSMQPADQRYSRAIVMPRTTKEDIGWIDDTLGHDPLLQKAIYTVDKPVRPYTLPANKGHEVMAYLTFIIDFYDKLPDVSIFMHAHLLAWHNNELLDMSSAQMLKHLNLRKVVRDGYFNLRCHRYPSCPDHVFPIAKNSSVLQVPEEGVFAEAWQQILPLEPVPEVLSQPCCAQFAVSRERIRLLPRAQYKHFRRWLMYTPLEDRLSGRVWEYIYQYIWAGVPQFCPKEHVCYCDGYGLCFGGEKEYADFYAQRHQLGVLTSMGGQQIAAGGNATHPIDYLGQINSLRAQLEADKEKALLRGTDGMNRALEAGRPWQPGDGV